MPSTKIDAYHIYASVGEAPGAYGSLFVCLFVSLCVQMATADN